MFLKKGCGAYTAINDSSFCSLPFSRNLYTYVTYSILYIHGWVFRKMWKSQKPKVVLFDPLIPTIHIFLKLQKSTSIILNNGNKLTHMTATGEEGEMYSGPLKEYSRKISLEGRGLHTYKCTPSAVAFYVHTAQDNFRSKMTTEERR